MYFASYLYLYPFLKYQHFMNISGQDEEQPDTDRFLNAESNFISTSYFEIIDV